MSITKQGNRGCLLVNISKKKKIRESSFAREFRGFVATHHGGEIAVETRRPLIRGHFQVEFEGNYPELVDRAGFIPAMSLVPKANSSLRMSFPTLTKSYRPSAPNAYHTTTCVNLFSHANQTPTNQTGFEA